MGFVRRNISTLFLYQSIRIFTCRIAIANKKSNISFSGCKSMPAPWRHYGHRDVLVRGYVHEVVISCGAEVIARHPRSYEREDFIFEPLHYLALIEQKINALDQAAPLAGWQLPEE